MTGPRNGVTQILVSSTYFYYCMTITEYLYPDHISKTQIRKGNCDITCFDRSIYFIYHSLDSQFLKLSLAGKYPLNRIIVWLRYTYISTGDFILRRKTKMNNKLMTSAVIIGIIAAALITGILAITAILPDVAIAQRNNTASNTHNTTGSNAGLLTYENSTLGIKMQHPSNWTKQTTERGVTFTVLLSDRNTTNSEEFLAKLNASALRGFPTNLSLKAMADRVVDSYRHFLNNFQIQSYSNTTVAGNNAIKIVYSYTDPKNNMFNASDIATIANDKLYVIQYYYYAKSPKYQSYLETLQKMVSSFQIVK